MKNIILNIVVIVILIFVGIFLYEKYFVKPTVITTVQTKTDTIYVPDTIVSIEYRPKYKTITDTAWKYKDVDTAAILQAYFDKNYYQDTLVNDSALFVEVRDTVSENEIKSRKFDIIRNYPVVTKETIITKEVEANGLFVGAYVGNEYGLQLQYKYKKNIVGIGGGSDGFKVSYSYKIK